MAVVADLRPRNEAGRWCEVALVAGDTRYPIRVAFGANMAKVAFTSPLLHLAADSAVFVEAFCEWGGVAALDYATLTIVASDDSAVAPHRIVSESDFPDGLQLGTMELTPTRLHCYSGQDDSDDDITRESDGTHHVEVDLDVTVTVVARFTRGA